MKRRRPFRPVRWPAWTRPALWGLAVLLLALLSGARWP